MQCTKGMNGWYGANKCPPRDPTTHGSFASPGTQQCRKNGINAKLNCPRPVGAPLAVPGAVRLPIVYNQAYVLSRKASSWCLPAQLVSLGADVQQDLIQAHSGVCIEANLRCIAPAGSATRALRQPAALRG